jgi:hypothetical protein
MVSVSGLFKSVLGVSSVQSRTGQYDESPVIEADRDEEQIFLDSIAHLSPEEQEKRIQRREFYKRLASEQAMVEIEDGARRKRQG